MREREYLKGRYKAILFYTGLVMMLSGALMLSPLLALFSYPKEAKDVWGFALPALVLCIMGFLLRRFCRSSSPATLTIHEGGMVVLISWTTVIFFSSLPFVLLHGTSLSRAIFEAVSGWTTTGLSILDVTATSRLLLLWRSTMQLAGGAGLAIIMMSAIVGATGIGISAAEGRGDQLVPQVRKSARLVLIIYSGYAIAGVFAYRLAGLSFFDSINHSFAAVSTGGFSTYTENIGHWNSLAVESVSIPLMILGNLSFVTAWLLWRGKMRFVILNGEVRLQAFLIPFSAAAVFIFTCRNLYPTIGKAARVAVFETVSALTTTGFQTVGYGAWNAFGVSILIILMLIGGGTCSTAGGIKQFRIYFLWKVMIWEIKQSFYPRSVVIEQPVWEGERRVFVDPTRVRQVLVFVFIYLMTYVVGTLILCASGFSLQDSLFEFASAIGTVGLSIGVTSYSMPDAALWAETLAMYLGRLEFIIVFISVIKLAHDMRIMKSKKKS